MFFDTNLVYILKPDRNYVLPVPPKPYDFHSAPGDLMRPINYRQACIIRWFYTDMTADQEEDIRLILDSRDLKLLTKFREGALDEEGFEFVERKSKKLILDIITDKSKSTIWMGLFDEETAYEYTSPNDPNFFSKQNSLVIHRQEISRVNDGHVGEEHVLGLRGEPF